MKMFPHAAGTLAQPHHTPQPSPGRPRPCCSPHPHTSSHFRTHTGAIPVTSLCTHIPVCMAPKPGPRLVLHTLGAAWLGWWFPVPSVSPLLTPSGTSMPTPPPTPSLSRAASSFCSTSWGRAGTPYLRSLMADHGTSGMAQRFSPLLPPTLLDTASPSLSVRRPPLPSFTHSLWPSSIYGLSCYPDLSLGNSDAVDGWGELG